MPLYCNVFWGIFALGVTRDEGYIYKCRNAHSALSVTQTPRDAQSCVTPACVTLAKAGSKEKRKRNLVHWNKNITIFQQGRVGSFVGHGVGNFVGNGRKLLATGGNFSQADFQLESNHPNKIKEFLATNYCQRIDIYQR